VDRPNEKYLLWMTLPGATLAAALEFWLGVFGVFLSFVLLLLGFVIWVRFDGPELVAKDGLSPLLLV